MKRKVKEKQQRHSKSQSVKSKLIRAFLIPVLFIVLLGTITYLKSSKGLIDNYETSSLSTIQMMADYYELGFEMAASKATQINTNESVKSYYSGDYKGNSVEAVLPLSISYLVRIRPPFQGSKTGCFELMLLLGRDLLVVLQFPPL